jgi:hypothetical protein
MPEISQRVGFSLPTAITHFAKDFFNTLSSPQFYLDVLNTKVRRSVGFFVVSYFVLGFLATTLFATVDVPRYTSMLHNSFQELIQHYPDDLTFHWDGKVLSSSQTDVLQVPFPSFWQTQSANADQSLPTNLAMIDTSTTSVDDAVAKTTHASWVVFTQNQAYVTNNNGGWSSIDLTDLPGFQSTFTVDKNSLPNQLNSWEDGAKSVALLAILAYPCIFPVGLMLSRVISLMINALLVSYFIRFIRRPIPFWKMFQLMLHISVAAELVAIVSSHLFWSARLPMFGLTFWLYTVVVLYELRNVRGVMMVKKETTKEEKKN